MSNARKTRPEECEMRRVYRVISRHVPVMKSFQSFLLLKISKTSNGNSGEQIFNRKTKIFNDRRKAMDCILRYGSVEISF